MIKAYTPKRSIFYVLFFEVLGKPLTFVVSILTAYYFGTGIELDAYLWSTAFLLLISGIFIGSWPLVITPVLTNIESVDREQAHGYVSAVMTYGSLFILLVGAGVYILAEPIVRMLTDFVPETRRIAVDLLRNLLPYFVFNSIFQIERAIFSSYRNFKIPSILTSFSSILMILSIVLLTNRMFINSLVVGSILRELLQCAVPLFFLLKFSHLFSLQLRCDWTWIKKSFFMVLPFYVGQTMNNIVELFYRYLASGLQAGALSNLSYGTRIRDLAIGTLAFTVSGVMFTEFSRHYSRKDFVNFKNDFQKSVFTIWYLIIPVSTFLFFFGDHLIVLIFKRGAFDMSSVQNSFLVLQAYSFGIFALSAHFFTHKAFYAFHDTVTPTIVSVPNSIFYAVLYYYFAKMFSFYGIALANSLAAIWGFWLYLFIMHYKHLKVDLFRFFKKWVVFSMLSILCYGAFRMLLPGIYASWTGSVPVQILKTGTAFFVPLGFYFIIGHFAGWEESCSLLRHFKLSLEKLKGTAPV